MFKSNAVDVYLGFGGAIYANNYNGIIQVNNVTCTANRGAYGGLSHFLQVSMINEGFP